MTASRRGLAILTAIALVLGVIVALDRPPAAVVESRRLLPGFDRERVVHLTIERGDRTIMLERDDDGWRVGAPSPGPADPGVVDEILGALELASAARWIDRDAAARAGAALDRPRVRVVASTAPSGVLPGASEKPARSPEDAADRSSGTPRGDGAARGGAAVAEAGDAWAIVIGAAAGEELVWAATPAHRRAALVEAWVARALDRDELRARAVVPVAQPTGLELHADGVELVLSGTPLRVRSDAGTFRLAPDRARALVDALTALRFVAFPTGASPTEPTATLRVLGGDAPIELAVRGGCPGNADQVLLDGSRGLGCVARADWEALLAIAREIRAPAACDPRSLTDARLSQLAFADGTTLVAHGGDWEMTRGGAAVAADDAAIAELLSALRTPSPVVNAPARTGAPVVTVTYADGTVDTLAVIGETLRRNDEPCALAVAPQRASQLADVAATLVDRTVLDEDPYLLRSIKVDGRIVTMGSTFETWTAPGATVDTAAVLAVRDAASSLVADAFLPEAPLSAIRTLVVHYDAAPVAGSTPTAHTLAIARPLRDGRCRAEVDDRHALLSAEACEILLAPLLR